MIKVNKNNKNITISGHAGSNDYGKDIVCASVSSIIYTTINAIKRINCNAIDVIDKENMEISILSDDDIVKVLVDNMMDLLNSLANDYPKNISVKES